MFFFFGLFCFPFFGVGGGWRFGVVVVGFSGFLLRSFACVVVVVVVSVVVGFGGVGGSVVFVCLLLRFFLCVGFGASFVVFVCCGGGCCGVCGLFSFCFVFLVCCSSVLVLLVLLFLVLFLVSFVFVFCGVFFLPVFLLVCGFSRLVGLGLVSVVLVFVSCVVVLGFVAVVVLCVVRVFVFWSASVGLVAGVLVLFFLVGVLVVFRSVASGSFSCLGFVFCPSLLSGSFCMGTVPFSLHLRIFFGPCVGLFSYFGQPSSARFEEVVVVRKQVGFAVVSLLQLSLSSCPSRKVSLNGLHIFNSWAFISLMFLEMAAVFFIASAVRSESSGRRAFFAALFWAKQLPRMMTRVGQNKRILSRSVELLILPLFCMKLTWPRLVPFHRVSPLMISPMPPHPLHGYLLCGGLYLGTGSILIC